MLDTSIRDYFTSSCPEKIIEDKNMWWTNELNKLRKNTRRKLRVTLRYSGLEHWESYHEARQTKVNSWRNFCKTTTKVPELTRLRKIRARDRGMEEPLRLPTGDFTKIPREVLAVLLRSHFPGARINRGPEKSLNRYH